MWNLWTYEAPSCFFFIYLLATVFIHLPLFILMSPIFSSGILVWFSMVTFIDDLLSKYLVYFLKEKSNVFSCFNIFQKIALNQLVTLVKIVWFEMGEMRIFNHTLVSMGLFTKHLVCIPINKMGSLNIKIIIYLILNVHYCLLCDKLLVIPKA